MAGANHIALRICNDCKIQKPLSEYGRNAGKSDGIHTYCRECMSARSRRYWRENRALCTEKQREKRRPAKEARAAARQAAKDSPEIVARRAEVRAAARERANISARRRYAANLEASRAKSRLKRLKNPAAFRASKARNRLKAKQNPSYVVHTRMSTRMNHAIKRGKAGRAWLSVVDYTLDDLLRHLERQFTKGMGWHNMGEWHIDHIVPVSSFNIESFDSPDFKRAWALTNLRPLWARENIVKRDRRVTLL